MTLSMRPTRCWAVPAATFAVFALFASQAWSAPFNGFNEHFNLGRSATTGAVCEANRAFDDPLVRKGGRVWNVTCRGWSQRLGAIYLFTGSDAGHLKSAWRSALTERADCDFAAGPTKATTTSFGQAVDCKTKGSNLDYVAFAPKNGGPAVAAEGRAAIADLLATGLKYVAGRAPEPAVVAEQSSDVSLVAGTHVGALGVGPSEPASIDSRFQAAYSEGQAWQFGDAEAAFGQLATSMPASSAPAERAEAMYNLALNVSNKGRFKEADAYFKQADTIAAAGAPSSVTNLAMNYRAAHARNQGRYEEAVYWALTAYAARDNDKKAPVFRDDSGAVAIAEVGGADTGVRVLAKDREALRQVQALEIDATSLEALGRTDEAQKALAAADFMLTMPLSLQAEGQAPQPLSAASPWLAMTVRADSLRMSIGTAAADDQIRQYRLAANSFGRKYPGSLPLAGYLVELARAESVVARSSGGEKAKALEDAALVDYEAGFEIFRNKRGSIEESADLVRPYFDILLKRLSQPSAADSDYTARFFTASQTLIAQSSADAAKRQAARTLAGDQKTAGLARALEDTGRQLDRNSAEVRDLQQRGVYQGADKARLDAQRQSLVLDSQTLENQLLQADPHFTSALSKFVKLSALQKELSPGEVYVKAFVLAGRGYGILVSPDGATPYAIDLSRADALAMIDDLRKPIDHPRKLQDGRRSPGRYDVALAHTFFLKVFGPVQDKVLGAKHVIYEPDANLIGAPLSALVVDEASLQVMNVNLERARVSSQPLSYAGVAWLGAKVTSSTALSASAFVQARQAGASKADRPFLGFGDPAITHDPRAFANVRGAGAIVGVASSQDVCSSVRARLLQMPSLPQTADEVKAIAASLHQDASSYVLGPDFTDNGIMRRGASDGDLSHYKVIYFTTHGIPAQPGCLEAALLTSYGGDGSDALLDVRKIPSLVIDADMVVLSACDTGRSDNGGGGEALSGLVATFVQAGARNLVVSNWEVDAGATKRLMIDMFATQSANQSEALAQAERKMMASPDQYSHPYFWAPFMVVGDGARAMPSF
jgi:hypothetical protein